MFLRLLLTFGTIPKTPCGHRRDLFQAASFQNSMSETITMMARATQIIRKLS
jgi:hypothetical protein